jgi:hypothetical protein
MNTYKIQSPLLLAAIFGKTNCKHLLSGCNGYLYCDYNNIGRGFIEFCISKIFNIHRIPGFEQFYLNTGASLELLKAYKGLCEEDINDACNEIKKIYDFTQNNLANSVKSETISLRRHLNPFEEEYVAKQLANPSVELIELPVNILNSYTYDRTEFKYRSNIDIVREIDIKKILMVDEYIQDPFLCCESIRDDEREVWVIEENMFGLIKVNKNCFYVDKTLKLPKVENHQQYYFQTNKNDEKSLFYNKSDIIPLPCEYGSITKLLIKRNKKKINKLYKYNDI